MEKKKLFHGSMIMIYLIFYLLNKWLIFLKKIIGGRSYIFDKDKFAELVYYHYLMREIAYETPELFRHFVKVKMNEIMAKYLPLIWSTSIKYDILRSPETFRETEDYTKNNEDVRNNMANGEIQNNGTSSNTGSSNSTSSSSNSSSGLVINDDTPQGRISKESILNGTYASSTQASENTSSNSITDSTSSSSSNESENKETSKNTSSTAGTVNETFHKEKFGYDFKMSNAEKILEFRKTIENYKLQIIEELNPLFFALY